MLRKNRRMKVKSHKKKIFIIFYTILIVATISCNNQRKSNKENQIIYHLYSKNYSIQNISDTLDIPVEEDQIEATITVEANA